MKPAPTSHPEVNATLELLRANAQAVLQALSRFLQSLGGQEHGSRRDQP